MKFWAIVALLFSVSATFASGSDPLFSKMEGAWTGQGVRTEAISGRQIQVQASVTTRYESIGGVTALVSQNQLTETAAGAAPNTYQTVYWVRPKNGSQGTYELGAPGQTEPSSTGVLGLDGIFRVEQDLGAPGTYVIRSETVFTPDQTVYSDKFTDGTELQSQTRIVYQRTTASF